MSESLDSQDHDRAAEPAPPTSPTPPAAPGAIRSGKLAGRSFHAAIWILAWPVLLQQTMQACVGMADKMLAGRLEGAVLPALDAIGIGSYLGWFIGIAMAGLGIGGQAIIARAMGAGDAALAHRTLGQAVTLSLVWGALVGVALYAMAFPIGRYAGLDDRARDMLVSYLGILALSLPMCAVLQVGTMCLHGAGETARPFWIMVLVNVVNVAASWLLSGAAFTFGDGADALVLVNPFGFDYGVAGIAAGTAIGWTIGGLAMLGLLLRGVQDLRLERPALRPRRDTMGRIVRVGIPSFGEGIAMWAVNLFVLGFIGTVAAREAGGSGLVGAHVVAIQWEAFSFMPGFAIGTAAGALAGQYVGAGNVAMARRSVWVCTAIAGVLMGSLGVVYMLFGDALTRVVTDEPIHLETVPRLLFVCGVTQVPFAVAMVVRQGLKGMGDTRWCLIITAASSYVVRLPAAWLLGIVLDLGIVGIWIALCGEFVVRGVLFAARFLHGGWERLRV